MPGTVVPYERFLEIRQRRNRVTTTLPAQPVETMIEEVLDHDFVGLTVDEAGALKFAPSQCLPVDPNVPTASKC